MRFGSVEMFFIILGGVIAAMIILYVACTAFYFKFAIRGSKADEGKDREFYEKHGLGEFVDEIMKGRAEFDKAPFETVEITSFDGLKLKALRVKTENSKGTLIFFHGYRSLPKYDFAASYPFYSKLGYDLLFPYQRAHGISEGKYITFGVKERKDALSWVGFINNEMGYQKDIYLCGISMGCATVLMGIGEGYPKNVRGIIADCGFTSPYEIISHVADKIVKFGKRPLMWSLDKACAKIAGFKLKEYSTVDAIKNAECPIIFFHGEADDFVPMEMTVRNYDTFQGKKTIMTVPSAGHGISYLYQKEKYEKAITDFIAETCSKSE